MLQKKEYQQRYRQYRQNLMLQNKELPTTTTTKKPIVENQTSGKIKPNVTKEGIPTKIPTIPTKPNVTKQELPTTTNKETNCRKSNFG